MKTEKKLHISINDAPLNGYLNLSPIWMQGRICCDPRTIDEYAASAECTEILAPSILDYIHVSYFAQFLDHLVSKLRHGGKILLGGTDMSTVAKQLVIGGISLVEANSFTYGEGDQAWLIKKGSYSAYEVSEYLKSKGLRILSKKLSGFNFIVEAIRE